MTESLRPVSTRGAPGWFVGKSGLLAAQAWPESQNPDEIAHLPCITGRRESDKITMINGLTGFGHQATGRLCP